MKAQVISVIHLDNSFAVLPILLLNQPTPLNIKAPHPRRRKPQPQLPAVPFVPILPTPNVAAQTTALSPTVAKQSQTVEIQRFHLSPTAPQYVTTATVTPPTQAPTLRSLMSVVTPGARGEVVFQAQVLVVAAPTKAIPVRYASAPTLPTPTNTRFPAAAPSQVARQAQAAQPARTSTTAG